MKKNKTIIDLQNVWKTYHMGEIEVHALRGLNLRVERGEFLAIMGPSGSGKSTCVSLVGCLDTPTKGKIFLEGKDISKLSRSELSQIRGRKIGFVFQQFNLMPTMNALDNVSLPMVFQEVSKEDRARKAKKLLEDVGLGHRLTHRPSEMSGGELQRVAIARSLANNPDVILADEPTGNLDSKSGNQVMEILSQLHKKEKRTIVMVTHDQTLAKYAERVCLLKDGQITSCFVGVKNLEA